MDDILHILDMLKTRAEADLSLLIAQRQNYLSEINRITAQLKDGIDADGLAGRPADMVLLAKWQQLQAAKIKNLTEKTAEVETEINLAKAHLQNIFAKYEAAKKITRQEKIKTLKQYTKKQEQELSGLILAKPVK